MIGAVPIGSMGTAPFSAYRQFQRVKRVLEYLADPALPLCYRQAVVSWAAVGYGLCLAATCYQHGCANDQGKNANSGCNDDARSTGVSQ